MKARWCDLLAIAAWSIFFSFSATNGVSQTAFPTYLVAHKPVQSPGTVLTIYGYPGSTNQVQYRDLLATNSHWAALSNVVLTTSSLSVSDPTAAQAGVRFYRVLALGATPLSVPTNLIWIPPGQFLMGSPSTEQDRNSDEGPQTWVTLSRGFYMGKYLVTQGEYLAIMGNNPSYFLGDTNRPVESCGWYNATNYCGKLTLQEQAAGRLPSTWCYRLPTEAEWEYACRAGTSTRLSYGDDPGYTLLTNYAWYVPNSYSTNKPAGTSYYIQGRYYTSQPVGQKLPNPWGLYDMYGNLSEWCQDWFGFYPGGAVVDPQGPATGDEHILRSGSWYDETYTLRSAYRYFALPDNVSAIYGFRVVLAPAQ